MISNEGYDVDAVHETSNDLYCVICLKLMKNPVQFKCGHGMCYGCYKNLSKKSKQRVGEDPCCPQCREIIRDNHVISNIMLHRFILSLIVRCPSTSKECFWTGELSELDNHLDGCPNSDTQETEYSQRRSSKLVAHDCLQNDILVSLSEQISIFESKLDWITNALLKQSVGTIPISIRSDKVEHVESIGTQSKRASKKKHGAANKSYFFYQSSKQKIRAFAILVAIILLFMIYVLTAKVFEIYEEGKSKHPNISLSGKEKLLKSNFIVDTNFASESFKKLYFSVSEKLDQLHSEVLSRLKVLESILEFLIQQKINDLIFREEHIQNDILFFYEKQNRRLNALSKKFFVHIEQSRHKVNQNISEFEENALKQVLVENVQSLQPLLHTTMSYLNGYIFPELEIHYGETVEKTKCIVHIVKSKLRLLKKYVSQLAGISLIKDMDTSISWNILNQLNELKLNISRSYKGIDESRSVQAITNEIDALRLRFDYTLNGYYANISHAISYKERFRGLMLRLQTVNLTNGVFMWKLNVSAVLELDKHHAIHSEVFRVVASVNSSLLMYKDENKERYWKITYTQEKYLDVDVQVTILNQLHEEQLLCLPSLIGEIKNNSTTKFYKFFSIPLTLGNLKMKGFIHYDMLYIKVLVTKK